MGMPVPSEQAERESLLGEGFKCLYCSRQAQASLCSCWQCDLGTVVPREMFNSQLSKVHSRSQRFVKRVNFHGVATSTLATLTLPVAA